MTNKPKSVDIAELGLEDRDVDAKIFAEHQEAVASFMQVMAKQGSGVEIATMAQQRIPSTKGYVHK